MAIFASGGGSNAEEIIRHFAQSSIGEIALIVSNKPDAYVLERAKNHNIPFFVHSADDVTNGGLEAKLSEFEIDLIVLAGYLKKISPSLIAQFPKKIVNIHPALLPAYGGKGMYGMNVHRAVAQANDRKSGITIHYVNENYDEGNIIEQHITLLSKDLSPEKIQQKVLELEHRYFPRCIEMLLHKL